MALIDDASWVDHTHRVIESLDDLSMGVSRAMSAWRGFALTGDSEQLDRYTSAIRALTGANSRVRLLTSDNPSQQSRLNGLEPLLAKRISRFDTAIAHRRAHGFDLDREARESREATMANAELWQRVADLATEERRLLAERERRTAQHVVRTKTIEAAGACLSVALIVAGIIRLRREIRRREHSEQTVRDSEHAIRGLNNDLERRVERRTAELEMANRELEAFGYSVVHNLRAPLRGMEGFAAVLLNDCEDTLSVDARECLGEIQQNARTMATLIDALVSMSRIARTELRSADVDLTALVRVVAGELATAESGPPVVLGVEEHLRAEVDPRLARALVEILLGNSWKFTAKVAAPRVDFGSTETDGERVLFVRDNGAGFDMAHAAQLFIPFGRLHTAAEFPGLGIGLATAQRIVQRHGGRIWADGQVGEGAAFYFTLGRGPEREVA